MNGLADTSLFIAQEQRRPLDDAEVDSLFVSVITIAELSLGVIMADDPLIRAQRLATVSFVQANFEPLPVDESAAQAWVRLVASLRRIGRRPYQTGLESTPDVLGNQVDSDQRQASSLARSAERREFEDEAVSRCLGQIIRGWQQKSDFQRIEVLELLFVKGWANRDVAKFLRIGEQQVANFRFAAVRKLTELVQDAGLPLEVFPELQESPPGGEGP